MVEHKKCTKCLEIKEVTNFSHKSSWCKVCKNVLQQLYRVTPAGKATMKRANIKRKEAGGDKLKLYAKNINRKSLLKTKYGMSLEEYDSIEIKQNSCCAICGIHKENLIPYHKEGSVLCVDHCHTTQKVRGLLCFSCNLMLGYSKDNTTTLLNAIKYLDDSNNI